MAQQAAHQAYQLATVELFLISAVVTPVIWLARRTMIQGERPAAE